ncbi:MAG: hypothetical protein J3Q66DRAFT_402513 [Benniella sp.]|nr:MAG: hypothetical protein J3Q66DRAFT_402513 [Benniella sp.]
MPTPEGEERRKRTGTGNDKATKIKPTTATVPPPLSFLGDPDLIRFREQDKKPLFLIEVKRPHQLSIPVGTNFVIKDKKLSIENRELIKQALSKAHSLGVLRGDLRLESIIMAQDQPKTKFRIIDFGLAEETEDEERFKEEMDQLNHILG